MDEQKPIVVVVGSLDELQIEAVRELDDRIIVIDSLSDLEEDVMDRVLIDRQTRDQIVVMTERRETFHYITPMVSRRPERDWENGQRRRMKPRRR